jgi:pimeloyl-ACP methyl ester carboxylesterase
MDRTGNPEFPTLEEQNLFYDYQDYVRENFVPILPPLTTGDYALVWPEYVFGLNIRTPWDRWVALIVPTAYADDSSPENVFVTNFTITEETPPPTGASNVLFLPGVLGSRLFEASKVCFGDDDGVNERWPELPNCDLWRLETDFLGNSLNDLFTYSDDRGRIDQLFTPNIYESFINELEEWKDDETIADFTVVPYDWRLSIDAIINTTHATATNRLLAGEATSYTEGYLYKTIARLAESSLSGKVTLVTHSNGGLVAKGFLRKLDDSNDPLLQKVDRLIMVAAPQVGTPEALWALLHGTELGFIGYSDGFLDKETSRLLLNKMAFAHHLLPNQHYFDRVPTAVITFEDGVLTTPWKDRYERIRDRDTLHDFLDDESGRPKPRSDDLLQPEVVDAALLRYARTMEAVLNWDPPSSIKVIQIAGTGLDTPAGLTYFTDRECVRFNFSLAFLGCAEYQPKMGYRVNTVIDGDRTVVVPSALFMPKAKAEQWWLNLYSYNNQSFTTSRKHSNIFEVDEVIAYIHDKITNNSDNDYYYLSSSIPNLVGERLTFQLHSPLDLSVVTTEGEVSSSTIEVSNAVYRQIGELQYLSLPADTPNIQLRLRGKAAGSFTLDIEQYEGNDLQGRQTFSGIPSATTTVVTASINENLSPLRLAVDYDGNGVVDLEYDEQGLVPMVTYESVRRYITNLTLSAKEKTTLLNALRLAEQQNKNRQRHPHFRLLEGSALMAIQRLVSSYGNRRLLSPVVVAELTSMIDVLIKQTKI